jgi:hypothetical protein
VENDGRDPETLVALLFRIVDVPRRTLAAAALVVLVVAAVTLFRFPLPTLVRNGTLCGSGMCLAGAGLLRRRVTRSASDASRRHEHHDPRPAPKRRTDH